MEEPKGEVKQDRRVKIEEKLKELKEKQAVKEEEWKKKEEENANDAFLNPSVRQGVKEIRKRSRSRSKSPQAAQQPKKAEEISKKDRLKMLKDRFKQRKLHKVVSSSDDSD